MKNENDDAKYEVGQEVMGFHKPLVGESYPMCGIIKKIWVSSKTHEYNYIIDNLDEDNLSGTLVEDEVQLFNEGTWELGYTAWKQYTIFVEMAQEQHKLSILYLTRRQK